MMRCPHCGSTAQPKLNTSPSIYKKGELVITTHKCGCGCVFERRYTLSEIKIVTQGKWVITSFSFCPGRFTRAQICEQINIYLWINCKQIVNSCQVSIVAYVWDEGNSPFSHCQIPAPPPSCQLRAAIREGATSCQILTGPPACQISIREGAAPAVKFWQSSYELHLRFHRPAPAYT